MNFLNIHHFILFGAGPLVVQYHIEICGHQNILKPLPEPTGQDGLDKQEADTNFNNPARGVCPFPFLNRQGFNSQPPAGAIPEHWCGWNAPRRLEIRRQRERCACLGKHGQTACLERCSLIFAFCSVFNQQQVDILVLPRRLGEHSQQPLALAATTCTFSVMMHLG